MNADAPSSGRLDAGLAVLRVVVGIVFLAHGVQKVFDFGLGGIAAAFAASGVPLADITGPLVALVEFGAGLALILGLFTRLAGVGIAAVMLGAIFLVHLPSGFFLPNGIEFALTLLAAAVALILAGPGAWSLDAVLSRRRVRS